MAFSIGVEGPAALARKVEAGPTSAGRHTVWRIFQANVSDARDRKDHAPSNAPDAAHPSRDHDDITNLDLDQRVSTHHVLPIRSAWMKPG